MQSNEDPDHKLIQQAKQAIGKIKQIKDNPEWQQFSTEPCKMYRMYIGQRLLSKGEAVLKFKMRDLLVTLMDEEMVKNLNCQLREVSVLRDLNTKVGGNRAKVNYLCFDGAWPIEARDFVNITISEEGENTSYIASMRSSFSHPRVENVTRAICHIVGYALQKIDEETTKVTYISDVDLAGSIPQALKNKLIERQAVMPKTIEEVFGDTPAETVDQGNQLSGGNVDWSTLD